MLNKIKSAGSDRKTAEKTRQLKKELRRKLHEVSDVNDWCDSIIAANRELDNIVSIEPRLDFIGLGEEAEKYDFSDRQAIFNTLGFCGCGKSDEALAFIKKGLEHIKKRNDAEDGLIEKSETAVFGSEGAATFFYYWADRERLIDHGSSVPGWLDDKGELLLFKLAELGY